MSEKFAAEDPAATGSGGKILRGGGNMNILGDITLGGIKGLMEGAGSLAKDIRSAITGEISTEKKAELLQKADALESQGMQAQADINRIEAANPNVFVSGWRPALGWVCVFGIGYQMVFRPLLGCALAYWNPALPQLDISSLISLVVAMLGIAGYRTAEKTRGIARN